MRDICIVIPTLDKERGEEVGRLAQISAGTDTRLEIVHETEERGFTAAVNTGLARTLPTEDVCLLNDDVEQFSYSWLMALQAALYSQDNYGIAVPSGHCSSSTKNGHLGDTSILVSNTVPFWCALIRREVFDAIGYLDKDFIHYSSDTWFCTQARRAKWRSVWVKAVYLWHKHEGSGFRKEWKSHDSEVFKKKMFIAYTQDVFK